MKKCLTPVLFCVFLVLLTSCSKQQDQPQVVATANNTPPAAQGAKDNANESLELQSSQELAFGTGTKALIWNLRGQKVKELTARLLIQEGEPFGVEGKHLLSLGLSFQSGEPSSSTAKSSAVLLPNKGPDGESSYASIASTTETQIAREQIVYFAIPAPLKTGVRNIGTEDDIVESSKDGGVAVAVIVDWKP